jgi:hypothetical protein
LPDALLRHRGTCGATPASSHLGIRLALSNGQDRRTATANFWCAEPIPSEEIEVSELGGDKEADDAASACSALSTLQRTQEAKGRPPNQ